MIVYRIAGWRLTDLPENGIVGCGQLACWRKGRQLGTLDLDVEIGHLQHRQYLAGG